MMRIVGIKAIKKYSLTVEDSSGNHSDIPIDENSYLHLKHAGARDIFEMAIAQKRTPIEPDLSSIKAEDWHLEMSKRFNNTVINEHTVDEETLRKAVGFGVVSDTESDDPGEFNIIDRDEDDEDQQL